MLLSTLNSWFLGDGIVADIITTILQEIRSVLTIFKESVLSLNPAKCEGIKVLDDTSFTLLGALIREECSNGSLSKGLEALKVMCRRLNY